MSNQERNNKFKILKDGKKIGEIDCDFLALKIDGLTVHNTAIKPHSRHDYEVVEK